MDDYWRLLESITEKRHAARASEPENRRHEIHLGPSQERVLEAEIKRQIIEGMIIVDPGHLEKWDGSIDGIELLGMRVRAMSEDGVRIVSV